MLKVEEWANDKNPVIVFFAVSHALAAREKSEALRHIKERRMYSHQFPPFSSNTNWHKLTSISNASNA